MRIISFPRTWLEKENFINFGMIAYRVIFILMPVTFIITAVLLFFRKKWGIMPYLGVGLIFSILFIILSACGTSAIKEQIYDGFQLSLSPGGYIAPFLIIAGSVLALITCGNKKSESYSTGEVE